MTKILLFILNKWFNGTPCKYGLINNTQAFDRGFLDGTLESYPEMTLKGFLKMIDQFNECGKSKEGCVIKGGIIYKGDDILYDELTNNQF